LHRSFTTCASSLLNAVTSWQLTVASEIRSSELETASPVGLSKKNFVLWPRGNRKLKTVRRRVPEAARLGFHQEYGIVHMNVGIDVLDVARIRKLLREHRARFVRRVFTERELSLFPRDTPLYYALAFSFKEAFWKTLPVRIQKGTWFNNIEVVWRGETPAIFMRGREIRNLVLRFACDREFVITAVVRR